MDEVRSLDLAILPGVTRPGADVRKAQSPKQFADGALVIRHPEPLLDDALKIA